MMFNSSGNLDVPESVINIERVAVSSGEVAACTQCFDVARWKLGDVLLSSIWMADVQACHTWSRQCQSVPVGINSLFHPIRTRNRALPAKVPSIPSLFLSLGFTQHTHR
jgi:hypothetical protein